MAEPGDGAGARFGQMLVGGLKLVGGKVVDFGGTVAGKVVDVGGTVGRSVVDVGRQVVDLKLFESDFERMRQLNQLAKQQQDLRRKYTEQELAAVEARADLVLGQLYTGYFEANFDPVAYELAKLGDNDGQEQIDELVERLTQGVETVSGRLSRHVNKKRDVLLAGIDRVAEVEDDLKAAFLISRSSRATLHAAAEEVSRNMRVVGQTRRKQAYMGLMEVVSKIKRARDLQHLLKRSQELGEYGDAIMTCMQCFQGVDTLRQLTVSGELRATVQRLYVDTLRRLDGALTNICSEFDPDKYTKILEGYLLQGIDGKALAEKVLQCFKDSIADVTTRVVRSLLLTKPKLAERLAGGGALDVGYAELCRSLPVDLLRPCLLRLLEVLFDVLASYHVMAHWHGLAVQKQAQLQEAAAGMEEDAQRVQAATANFLTCVCDMMKVSRPEVLDAAARRIKELLTQDNLFKGEDFLQMIDWCGKFVGMGEAFLGGPTELRPQVMAVCARVLPTYHRSNLESLTTCLANEVWQDVTAASGGRAAVALDLDGAIRSSPYYVPAWGEPEALTSFDDWVTAGNPFIRVGQGPEAKQKSLVDLLHKTQTEGKQLSRSGSEYGSLADKDTEAAGISGGGAAAAGSTGGPGSVAGDGPEDHAAADGAAAAEQRTSEGGATAAGQEPGSGGADGGREQGAAAAGGAAAAAAPPGRPRVLLPAMLTVSSQQACKYMRHYGQIMRPLSGHSEYLFRCLAELFDVYMLYCFSAFGGMGLEELVWRDDVISPRLKGALLRILTAEGSKYRGVVEELMRTKPVGRGAPIASTGLGLLDRFGDKMESLADSVERQVGRMAVKLNASDSGRMTVQTSGNSGMLTPVTPSRLSVTGTPGSGPGALIGGGGSSAAGSPAPPGAAGGGSPGGGGHSWGVRERVVAVESLMYLAQELKAAKQAITLALPGRCQRDVENYFNRTVEVAADLRDYLFKAAARAIMGVWDKERGIPAAIGVTNYNVREPATKQSDWSDFTVRALAKFRERVLAARLPPPLVVALWEHAAAVVAAGLLDGLAAVRRCSLEGRANMSLDLSHVEKQMRAMGPPNFRPALGTVDAYIKAFYLPWDDLPKWCHDHIAEYGKQRLFTLVEVAAEFNKVKRGAKNDLLERIESYEAGRAF